MMHCKCLSDKFAGYITENFYLIVIKEVHKSNNNNNNSNNNNSNNNKNNGMKDRLPEILKKIENNDNDNDDDDDDDDDDLILFHF
ncbi:hypothetical protein G9A89_006207 [Geosiphon pyriformis]|nr:hypothetical protein G9A89_006207 [Geosiphon pyriformis]